MSDFKNSAILFKPLLLLMMLTQVTCTNSDSLGQEKSRPKEKIIDVSGDIRTIDLDIVISPRTSLTILDNILLVTDGQSDDKGIHLLDKNSFKYITSTGKVGRGPGEIVRYGRVAPIPGERAFWIADYGKTVMWRFSLDSILLNDQYLPEQGPNFGMDFFLTHYDLLNDSIALGMGADVTSVSTYNAVSAKMNLISNEIAPFGYMHPEADGKMSRAIPGLSLRNQIFVKCYTSCDLMNICDLEGNLKFNVYGPRWKAKEEGYDYYSAPIFIDDNIIVAYSGEESWILNEYGRPEANLPTKFLVFDVNGNYRATLETNEKFFQYCADEDNNRIFLYFTERDEPLAYFDLQLL